MLYNEPWILAVGGMTSTLSLGSNRYSTVELISLDEVNHPVPACLRFPKVYPNVTGGPVGAPINGGNVYIQFMGTIL